MDASLTFQTGEVTAPGGGTISIPCGSSTDRRFRSWPAPGRHRSACHTTCCPTMGARCASTTREVLRTAARAGRGADRRPGRRRAEGSGQLHSRGRHRLGRHHVAQRIVDSRRRASGCSWSRGIRLVRTAMIRSLATLFRADDFAARLVLPDAALMFMAYNQLAADRVVPGNTLRDRRLSRQVGHRRGVAARRRRDLYGHRRVR